MATNKNINYKADFCRNYFYQLKGFVKEFNIYKNNLGMEFLLDDVYRENPEQKLRCHWNNTVIIEDKGLMLAIEEFFHITQQMDTLQEQRNRIFEGLMNTDKDQLFELLKNVLIDQQTLKAILFYFGVKDVNMVSNNAIRAKSETIENYIRCFEQFAYDAAYNSRYYKNTYTIYEYRYALHLFQQHRNIPAHVLTKMDVPHIKIFFQFIAFLYIGLTYLLRQTWLLRNNNLKRYEMTKEFKEFGMPSQVIKLSIKTDDNNDKITSYEFTPNIANPSNSIKKNIEPTDFLEVNGKDSFRVKKYDCFKLSITYKSGESRTVTFGENGELMLTYYFWTPTLEIHLPSIADIKPGISSTGNANIDDKIAKLFEDAIKRKDEVIRDSMLNATNDLINALQPKLDEIKKLYENNQEQHNKEREELENELNVVLDKQIKKNEESLNLLLNNSNTTITKIDELKTELAKLQAQNDNQKEYMRILSELVENQKSIEKKVNELFKGSYRDLGLPSPDGNKTWIKSVVSKYVIPSLGLLTFFAFFFGWGLYTIPFCMIHNIFLGLSIAVVFILLEAFFLMWEKYPSIPYVIRYFRKKIKSIGKTGYIKVCLTSILFLTAVGLIPFSISSFKFDSPRIDLCDKEKAAGFIQKYVNSNPYFDESARIQLAYYYLNYTDEEDKAWKVTLPIWNNQKKYKDGILALAEVIYNKADNDQEIYGSKERHDLFTNVWDLISQYKQNNGRNIITDRLEGIMMMKGQGRSKDVHKGYRLLFDAAKTNDAKSNFYFAYILSHDMTDWNKLKIGSEDTIQISQMNIVNAPSYYRCAIDNIPKSALVLGDFYADLNMVDSAKYYYAIAMKRAPEESELFKKATFKMGLMTPKIDKDNEYLNKARGLKHIPALLYQAIVKEDAVSAIGLYERAGIYKGYRYIPPVVFNYIALGQKKEALQCLKDSRNEGLFDKDFVNGMELMLKENKPESDSLMAMNYIIKSANKGCEYAQLLCIYRELEHKVLNNIPVSYDQINVLDEYGKSIPFAYVLESYLYKELGDYEGSEVLGMKAVGLNHPAGALLLAGNETDQYKAYEETMMSNEKNRLLFNRIRQTALMSNPEKESNLYPAYISMNYNNINYNELSFWSDVAIANHYFDFECYMLQLWLTGDNNEIVQRYKERLLRSILSDLDSLSIRDKQKSFLVYVKNQLSVVFLKELEKEFEGNKYIQDILKTKSSNYRQGDNLKITIGRLKISKKLADKYLLDEFSSVIDENYYKCPIEH